MTESEYYDDQYQIPTNGELVKVTPIHSEPAKTPSTAPVSLSPDGNGVDPGLNVLVEDLSGPLRRHTGPMNSDPALGAENTSIMAEKADEPPLPPDENLNEHRPPQMAPQLDDDTIEASKDSNGHFKIGSAKLTNDQPKSSLSMTELVTRTRADSMQVDASVSLLEKPSSRGSPLKIQTMEINPADTPSHTKRDSISASPTLSKHTIAAAVGNGDDLPPFEPPSPSTGSPQAERLPSIRQLTSTLTELAEAATQATQELPRTQGSSHHHSQSFGSAKSHSPILATHYPTSIQTSPQAYYQPTMARSPTNTIGGSPSYTSPPAYQSLGPYSHRRASMVEGMPPFVPNLPSASSSGDSYGGYPSSGTEGYSTNHTTPSDAGAAIENTPRPLLPPPPGLHAHHPPPPPIMLLGPFKCDVPDCTAGNFQTQYLLK